MINVFYSRIPDYIDESIIPSLSEYRQKRMQSITNEFTRRESICAELLLEKAVYPQFQRPLPILTGQFGKPFFSDGGFHFSLSHSGGWVACAVGSKPLGLDIQALKKCDIRLSDRFFAKDECAYIESAKEPDSAFIEVWAKKESRVKATGRGINQGLSAFSVFDSPNEYSYFVVDNMHFALCVPGEKTHEINIVETKLL